MGNKGLKLGEGDELSAVIKVEENSSILVLTEKGFGKRARFEDYNVHGRGTGGQRVFGNVDNKGEIIGALSVSDKDEIVCMTGQGKTLRVKVSTINVQGPSSSGVSVLKIDEPDYLVGLDKIVNDEDKEEKQ